ncbi:MAG: CO dehydrogenase/acetyl-CoA synthase complex subunit epsilon [Candidatus Bathyarchaeia archaeon]
MAEPWRRAEIAATMKALVIRESKQAIGTIKRAKNPILIVGHEAAVVEGNGKKPIDYAIELSEKGKIPIVATAQTVGEFLKRGFQPAAWMSAMDIGNRLSDPEWRLSGEGDGHDLAVFLGIPYNLQWTILSGLKHLAPHIKTISLDRFYHPHSNLSFPTLHIKVWHQKMEEIVRGVAGEG